MLLECRTCPVQGEACRDCVVTVLLDGPTVPLDAKEAAVVSAFLAAGLVDADQARELRARRDPVGASSARAATVSRAG